MQEQSRRYEKTKKHLSCFVAKQPHTEPSPYTATDQGDKKQTLYGNPAPPVERTPLINAEKQERQKIYCQKTTHYKHGKPMHIIINNGEQYARRCCG